MASNMLSLSINKSGNVPILLGGTSSFTASIRNLSPTERYYNLSLSLALPDGLTLSSSTITQTSKTTNTDGSSVYYWTNLKDLAALEVPYTFDITLKSSTTFKNGSSIPFGYVFSNIVFSCSVDTMPRGIYDLGNEKFSQSSTISFKAIRFMCTSSTSGKVLKGAGSSLSLNDYSQVTTCTCKFTNNTTTTSTVNISILLDDGIRYIGNISTSGTDASSFLYPNISTVSINGKQYIQLYYSAITLSKNSNTTLVFSYAIWNRYNNNLGDLLIHGTKLNISANMVSTSDSDSYSSTSSFSAMDLIISTSVTKSLVDIQTSLQFKYIYSVGQYYDLKDIAINYFIADGVYYNSSTPSPVSAVDDPTLKGFNLNYNFPTASKNSQSTVTINAVISSFYRYKLDSNNNFLPVVAFDSFIESTNISATTIQLNSIVTDSASTSCSINIAALKKEFLNGYYSDGSLKSISTLAPGDFAQYRLTYDALTLKATQKAIFVDDFFPLSTDPINNLNYSYGGYTPSTLTPQLIDPHGVDFNYGNFPGNSYSTITFKVPIALLGSSAQNINLLKLKGLNTNNIAYSNRTQVTVNIGTPNLQLTKTVTGPNINSIKAGEVYSYTVKISNTNTLGTETDAFNFTLSDAFSTWFTLIPSSISVSGTGASSAPTVTSSGIQLPINKLAPGQSLTLFYSVTIIDTLAPGVKIQTTATNTNPYSQIYLDGGTNFQYSSLIKTASTTISAPIIVLSKSYIQDTIKIGSNITYVLTLTIPQGTIAYGVTVSDTLPSGLQSYLNSASRNGFSVTPTVSGSTITFPSEGTIDARLNSQVITYTLLYKVTSGSKSLNALTSTQTNTGKVIYKQTSSGSTLTINTPLVVTINHPNIGMLLSVTDRTSSITSTTTANINTSSILDFKLTFQNNSNVDLINGVIKIPLNTNFIFVSINNSVQCSPYYDTAAKSIILSISSLVASALGFVTFTLIPVSSLRAGSTLTMQATATQYYNTLSSYLYSGEQSNILSIVTTPGVSLLPNPSDRIDDSTSYIVTKPGGTATIINNFKNTGGGYDDYSLAINAVSIPYSLYIDDIKIADVAANTKYQANLPVLSNLAPNSTKIFKILTTIPSDSNLGARYDFVVTVASKTSPYPSKTVLNIDPS
ncbi:conserved repeat domain-containing protein [Clostridium collagenovorans DSM 3089]|uniref:Conserved repeat domain-containing protein n=1 Tax=Clostridium collagenovorans DSM 3089 TaxID=1121306 RepID=A0A1M5X704_9CLOT|nr:DUF11 domain-containing protein [Clostridium collagenovorans]SHH95358.1 conserved repeat domain-containing protein [Clostridium collagenovorans DSM 3089]